MQDVKELVYQLDVVTTLVSNQKDDFILWLDSNNRIIETQKGHNKELTGFERRKIINDLYINI